MAKPNMSPTKVQMPEQEPDVRNKNFKEVALGYTKEMAMEEATRCLNCKHQPCKTGCPVGVPIPEFIKEVAAGNFEEAYKLMHREIIEIGATKVNNNGEVIDTFSCFVKPEFSSDVAGYITRLTGIKTTDVYQEASLTDALQSFSEWIGAQKTRIYS